MPAQSIKNFFARIGRGFLNILKRFVRPRLAFFKRVGDFFVRIGRGAWKLLKRIVGPKARLLHYLFSSFRFATSEFRRRKSFKKFAKNVMTKIWSKLARWYLRESIAVQAEIAVFQNAMNEYRQTGSVKRFLTVLLDHNWSTSRKIFGLTRTVINRTYIVISMTM